MTSSGARTSTTGSGTGSTSGRTGSIAPGNGPPQKYGEDGAVVGAFIQLGRCYDLMDTKFTRDLRNGAVAIHEMWLRAGAKVPTNRGGHRALDCAVVNVWLDLLSREGPPFQTVRRGFEEGPPVHEGMIITMQSHIQIAVRDPSCILGVFRPR